MPYMIVVVWMVAALSDQASGCLRAELLKQAGPNAVDCGTVSPDANRKATDRCVGEAFRAKKTFVAEYEYVAVDHIDCEGYAGRPDGYVWIHPRDKAHGYICIYPSVSDKGEIQCRKLGRTKHKSQR